MICICCFFFFYHGGQLIYCFFFFKQKTAYEITVCLEFRRVLFRSITAPGPVDAGSSGNVASVQAGPGGTTYNWSVSNGTINAGQGTPSISYTAGLSGPIGISVSVVTGT